MAENRTFLGEAATRLYRLLGLDGFVSPVFRDGADVVPVVILGDGTLPGYGQQTLRRFAASHQTVAGAGVMSTVLVATADVILTDLEVVQATAGLYTLTIGGSSQALPSAAATLDVFFTDRIVGSEPAPMLTGNGDGVAVTGSLIGRAQAPAANQTVRLLLAPIMLSAGCWLQVRGAAAALTHTVNLYGMAA